MVQGVKSGSWQKLSYTYLSKMIKYLAVSLSGLSLLVQALWHGWRYLRKHKAKLEVWSLTTVFATAAGTNTDNDLRPKITILFRNKSERPTSVVDLKARKEDGSVLGGRGYKERVGLPINIAPWEVQQVEFRMEESDRKNLDHIYIQDIDDHELSLNLSSGDWKKIPVREWSQEVSLNPLNWLT